MNLQQKELGYELETDQLIALFGGVHSQYSNITKHYPEYKFHRIKQIHGDAVVEALSADSDFTLVADAQVSQVRGLGLCVSTADCIPLLFIDSNKKIIGAAHAGWRGVANGIARKTLREMIRLGSEAEEIEVLIGPHIQKPSFEVGNDVRDQILLSVGAIATGDKGPYHEQLSAEKAQIDLNEVIKTQLFEEGIQPDHLNCLYLDTFSDKGFHSHRRDREKAGRQLSFILLK